MKRYQVNFSPVSVMVDAEDKSDAEVQAYELLFDGEVHPDVESVEVLKELEE